MLLSRFIAEQKDVSELQKPGEHVFELAENFQVDLDQRVVQGKVGQTREVRVLLVLN